MFVGYYIYNHNRVTFTPLTLSLNGPFVRPFLRTFGLR